MVHDEFIERAFSYLNRHLDDDIKKKLPPGVMKEVLRCLSVWMLQKGFSERIETKGGPAEGLSYQDYSDMIDETNERKRLKRNDNPD